MTQQAIDIIVKLAQQDVDTTKEYLELAGGSTEYIKQKEDVGMRFVPTGKTFLAQILNADFIAVFSKISEAVRKVYMKNAKEFYKDGNPYFSIHPAEIASTLREAKFIYALNERLADQNFRNMLDQDGPRKRLIKALQDPQSDQRQLLENATVELYSSDDAFDLLKLVNQIDNSEIKEDLTEVISKNKDFAKYISTSSNFEFVLLLYQHSKNLVQAYIHLLSNLNEKDLNDFRQAYEKFLLSEPEVFMFEMMEMIHINPALIGKLDIEKLKKLYFLCPEIGQSFMAKSAYYPEMLSSEQIYDELTALIQADVELGITVPRYLEFPRVYKRNVRRLGYLISPKEEKNVKPYGYQLAKFLINITQQQSSNVSGFLENLSLLKEIHPEALEFLSRKFSYWDKQTEQSVSIKWADVKVVRKDILKGLGRLSSAKVANYFIELISQYSFKKDEESIVELSTMLNLEEELSQLNKSDDESIDKIKIWQRNGIPDNRGRSNIYGLEEFIDGRAMRALLLSPLDSTVILEILKTKYNSVAKSIAFDGISNEERSFIVALFGQFLRNLEKIQSTLGIKMTHLIVDMVQQNSDNMTSYLSNDYMDHVLTNADFIFGSGNRKKVNDHITRDLLQLLNSNSDKLRSDIDTFKDLLGAEHLDAYLSAGNYTDIVLWIKLKDVLGESFKNLYDQMMALPIEGRANYLTVLSKHGHSLLLPSIVQADVQYVQKWLSQLKALDELFVASDALLRFGIEKEVAQTFCLTVFKSGQRSHVYSLRSLAEANRRKQATAASVVQELAKMLTEKAIKIFPPDVSPNVAIENILKLRNDPEFFNDITSTHPSNPQFVQTVKITLELILTSRLLDKLLAQEANNIEKNAGRKKLKAKVEILENIISLISKLQPELAIEIKESINLALIDMNNILKEDAQPELSSGWLTAIHDAFMIKILKSITGVDDIPQQLLNDDVLREKILTISNLYYTLAKHNAGASDDRTKMREWIKNLLAAYQRSNGDTEVFKKMILESPGNKEEIERLVSPEVGYSKDLWTKGVIVEKEVTSASEIERVEQLRKSINIASHELVEIALDVMSRLKEVPPSFEMTKEELEGHKMHTLEEVTNFIKKMKEALSQELTSQNHERIDQILSSIEKLEKTIHEKVTAVKPVKIRLVIKKDFIQEATAGVGVPGCFSPNGIHREMPIAHATESNAFFALIYDENGVMISNAVLALTDQGVIVHGEYNSRPDLSLGEVWFEAFRQLAQFVPAIFLPNGAKENIAGKAFVLTALGEKIQTAPIVGAIQRKTLYGPMYYDFGNSHDNGDWSYSDNNAVVLRKEDFPPVVENAQDEIDESSVINQPVVKKEDSKEKIAVILTKDERKNITQELFDLNLNINFKPILSQLDKIILTLSDGELEEIFKVLKPLKEVEERPFQEDKTKLRNKLDELRGKFKAQKAIDSAATQAQEEKAPDAAMAAQNDLLNPAIEKIAINQQHQDNASLGSSKKSDVGGIDLNPALLNLQTTGSGMKFNMPDPATLRNVHIEDFSPIIFQIIPTNLPLLLGLDTRPSDELASILPVQN